MATPARCRPVASFLRRGRSPRRHPMQRAMVRRDVVDAGVRSVPGLGVGPPPSDDTPCNGRWSGGMWWTLECGRLPGLGRGSARHGRHPMQRAMVRRDVVDAGVRSVAGLGVVAPSDDTPYNGRWSGRSGGRWSAAVSGWGGSAAVGRHPMQRAMVRRDVVTLECGRFLGWSVGPLATDDTPCNGRWSGRLWWTPVGRLLGTGRVRRRRTTPHATGDGPAGCGGHRVGAVAGHGSGPLATDDTPCIGRWSGGMWWTPEGAVAGHGSGPPPSDDTPCNGRWSGGMWWTPSGGGCWARVGSAAVGRHPMQRAMVRREVAAPSGGGCWGAGRGPAASDDTPCNGRWCGGRWRTPGGVGSWARGRVRRPRTTPHATGDGPAGSGGRLVGSVLDHGPGPPTSDDTPCNGRWSGRMWRTPGGVGSWARAGSAGLGRHPMQREMVRLVGTDTAVAPVPGQALGLTGLGRYAPPRGTVRIDGDVAGGGMSPGMRDVP